MRILDHRVTEVPDDLVETVHSGLGYRMTQRMGVGVCAEDDETFSRAAKFAIQAKNLQRKTVAWIGGGYCVGPRVFDVSNCTQTVYELEPALAEFCPNRFTFVPGDWHATLAGTYDVIVYDLGECSEADASTLRTHLNPGGLLLGVE